MRERKRTKAPPPAIGGRRQREVVRPGGGPQEAKGRSRSLQQLSSLAGAYPRIRFWRMRQRSSGQCEPSGQEAATLRSQPSTLLCSHCPRLGDVTKGNRRRLRGAEGDAATSGPGWASHPQWPPLPRTRGSLCRTPQDSCLRRNDGRCAQRVPSGILMSKGRHPNEHRPALDGFHLLKGRHPRKPSFPKAVIPESRHPRESGDPPAHWPSFSTAAAMLCISSHAPST